METYRPFSKQGDDLNVRGITLPETEAETHREALQKSLAAIGYRTKKHPADESKLMTSTDVVQGEYGVPNDRETQVIEVVGFEG